MLPPIAIVFKHPASESDFDELRKLLASGGTEVAIESRDDDGPYAGIEWLIPTAVILFIGKAYFDGFVKEIGKDHYILLKQGLKSLYSRFIGPKAPAVTVIATAGKSKAAAEYSLLFSLLAEAPDGLRFKLLIQSSATQEEYEATVAAFVTFVDAFHSHSLDSELVSELRAVRVVGKTVLLAYDSTKKRVAPVDPLAGRAQ